MFVQLNITPSSFWIQVGFSAPEYRGLIHMEKTKIKKTMTGSSITEGVIWKQLLRFFFPILLGTFFQQLYNTVDAVIVGNFVGKEALAAVGGSTGTLINLLMDFLPAWHPAAALLLRSLWRRAQGGN